MKTKKISPAEQFQKSMSLTLEKYYSDAISDNVRRAFEHKRKRLSTIKRVAM
jgi:hypothetical protein